MNRREPLISAGGVQEDRWVVGSVKRYIINLAAVALSLTFAGCYCPKQRIYSLTDEGLYNKSWYEVVKENPIGKDENIKVTPLFKNADSSHYIIQINDKERPHIHDSHDLTIIMKKGEGTLHLEDEKLEMKQGDVAFIPRGKAHWFENEHKRCAAISYVIFTPSYDGKDKRLAGEEGGK